ncbi:hypothetical protein DAI22_12g089250 [Oryza sativa Japonica Group]|nr:hypothetical protein DAI22_12g089250 [Oryza sativa Japonica Group]
MNFPSMRVDLTELPLRSGRKGIEIQRWFLAISLFLRRPILSARRRGNRSGRGDGPSWKELTVGTPHVGAAVALHPGVRVANMECTWQELVAGLVEEQ